MAWTALSAGTRGAVLPVPFPVFGALSATVPVPCALWPQAGVTTGVILPRHQLAQGPAERLERPNGQLSPAARRV